MEIDCVVLAALQDVDCQEVVAHLHDVYQWKDEIYHIEYTRGALKLGEGRTLSVVVDKMAPQTTDNAEFRATIALKNFNPSYLVLVGVANGLKEGGITIGDVVVADKVHVYGGYKKWGRVRHNMEFDLGVSDALVEQAKAIASDSNNAWWKTDKMPEDCSRKPNVHIRPIASGRTNLGSDNNRLFEFVRENVKECYAVGVEEYGVIQACHRGKVEVMVVRGISELAASKSPEQDGICQSLATANAAAFAFAVVKEHFSHSSFNSFPEWVKARQLCMGFREGRHMLVLWKSKYPEDSIHHRRFYDEFCEAIKEPSKIDTGRVFRVSMCNIGLTSLPESLSSLTALKTLSVRNNQLTSLWNTYW